VYIVAKFSFNGRGRRVKASVTQDKTKTSRSAEDIVRELKQGMQKPRGEDYRERSLDIHGLVCALCGREFDQSNRHLLTVHHKDGNHHNNPPDGSNWENLCVYCHENVHSRELLGDYYDGSSSDKSGTVVYKTDSTTGTEGSGLGVLGEKLQKAMRKKEKKP
jgi:hypothetical protein